MASPKIKFKRSAVASKRPSLGSLELGELALNTYDGKLFTRRDTSGVGIATTVSTINPWTENYGSSAISYDGNISVTGISTLGQQRFANATQQNFVQLYTGGASGSYFTQGEYQKIATITPDGNSQNYTFIIRLTATSASNYQIVTFSGGLRSNTLPNLSYTVNYSEEHNGVQFIEPKLWTKETATAGFILAFEYIHSSNLYGGVNVEAIIIPRSNAQRENVDFNTTQDSEQSSIDSGFTERDPTLTLSTENSIITVSDINSSRLNVTGLSTFASTADFNGDIDVDGHTELDNLNVSGVSTFVGAIDTNGSLDVDGHTELDDVNISGVATISSLGAVNSVCVVGTGKSITTSEAMTLDVANKRIGIGTANPEVKLHMVGNASQESQIRMEQYNNNADAPDVRIYRGRGTQGSPSDVQTGDYLFRLNVHGRDSGSDPIYHSLQMDVDSSDQDAGIVNLTTRDKDGNEANRFGINKDGAIVFNDAYTFPTSDGNADQVLVSDGSGTLSFADQSGVSTSNVSANTLVVSGFSTFAGASFSGNVSIAGTLTYDDVTNVDSIGIITARNGVRISSGGLSVSGVSTLSGNVNLSGDITSNVTIVSTDAGSSAAPELKLYRNSASPANADYLGQIKFAGESDTGVERNYAKITGKIKDASNGTEDGIIEIAHIKDGSQNISGRWNSETLQLINGTNLSVAGTLDVTGTTTLGVVTSVTSIEATTYYGDGSNLTGISAGAASTSNVSSNTTISGIITASDQFYPPTLTTSERDALTVNQGALIFNTTENKVQMYLGSEWKSLAFELDTYTAVGL